MKKTKIWAQVLCHNEEKFIWFALMSVVGLVDKVMVWDTGSTDKTVELIRDVSQRFPGKIYFRECGRVDAMGVTKLRQKMLDESKCDWFILVDGDEIWWEDSLKRLIQNIENSQGVSAFAVPYKVPVGDIYHLQDDKAGQYELAGRKGHLTIRAIKRNIKGLSVKNEYPLEGYVDSDDKLIQNRDDIKYLDAPYLHMTHLERSSIKRARNTHKIEVGEYVGENFKFPEVLYLKGPAYLPDPWIKLGLIQLFIASIITKLRILKRKLT